MIDAILIQSKRNLSGFGSKPVRQFSARVVWSGDSLAKARQPRWAAISGEASPAAGQKTFAGVLPGGVSFALEGN